MGNNFLTKQNNQDIFQSVKRHLSMQMRYLELNDFMINISVHPEQNPFKTKELCAKFIEVIIKATDKDYIKIINNSEIIYKTVFPLEDNTEDYEFLCNVFLKIFKKDGIFFRNLFSHEIYLCFTDKLKYIKLMDYIMSDKRYEVQFRYIIKYSASVRLYFYNEDSFLSAVMSCVYQLSNSINQEELTDILIENAKRASGIYAIDENTIENIEIQGDKVEAMLSDINSIANSINSKYENINKLADASMKQLQQEVIRNIEQINQNSYNATKEFKSAYQQILNQESNNIIFEKDKLVREIFDATDAKIRELKMVSDNIKNSTSAELHRINIESNRAIEKVEEFLCDNENLKDVMNEIKNNSDLIEKISKVETSSNIDTKDIKYHSVKKQYKPISEHFDTISDNYSAVHIPAFVDFEAKEENSDDTPNYYLNRSIPFNDKMNLLDQKIEKNIKENGEIYHESFRDVLVAVIENANPYLIGPSGCGKTYMIDQIAKLIEIDYIDIGYINEEYDLIGFQTANGDYSYPTFYKAYKYGKIAFCDELDNGNSRATVKLNSFLSNKDNASYCFPNGEIVKRHPNFRIIGAGNTSGNGSDQNYNTREKIEESIQQRFTPMFIDYDNRVEKQILFNYPDWFEFISRFRMATTSWSNENNYSSAPGIITTRDASMIKQYLDNGSFDSNAIIKYEFIETKDNDYLAFLDNRLKSYYAKNQGISSKIYEIFKYYVNKLHTDGGDT